MKYLALASIILLASCQNFMQLDYSVDLPKGVDSLESAYLYTASMNYKSDTEAHGQEEYWQGPEETIDRTAGDCEDFAILFAALAVELGYRGEVVFCYGHCVSRVDGQYYDPTPVLTDDGWKADAFEPVEVEDVERVYTVSEAVSFAIEEYGTY